MINGFKDLLIWQKSMDLVQKVYIVTQKLPAEEKWGLVSQIRRAAISVPSNIVEGYGRQSTGDYRRFLKISRGSLMELETQVILCGRMNYLSIDEMEQLITEIEVIIKMTSSLLKRITCR